MSLSIPIVINDNGFLGQGYHKSVFIHPNDPQKCIKIIYNEEGKKDINRELRYREHREKQGLSSQLIPQYYGIVETDRGLGYVFQRIFNYDGSTSPTLMDYIENPLEFQQALPTIIKLMCRLKKQLFQDRLISMHITPENIVFQRISPSETKLMLISDLGSSELIPLVLYFDKLAVAKINRRWQTIINTYPRRWPSSSMTTLINALRETI